MSKKAIIWTVVIIVILIAIIYFSFFTKEKRAIRLANRYINLSTENLSPKDDFIMSIRILNKLKLLGYSPKDHENNNGYDFIETSTGKIIVTINK